MNVLVLGGTGKARGLAGALHGRRGLAVTTALAQRVPVAELPAGDVRIGGFGGAAGLAAWLLANGTDVVVDASHPFSARITENAVAACAASGARLVVLRRPGWLEGPGDRWQRVPTASAAAERLAGMGERVFLPTGRAEVAAFAGLAEHWFLIRTRAAPLPPLPPRHRLIIERGPFTADAERALLREERIEVVVARDSGGAMTKAKLVAARELGLPVILVERPPPPPTVPVATSVEAAVAELTTRTRP